MPLIGFGQLTMIPDANFEQRLISFGYDNILDGTVLTAAIDTVTHLEVSYYGISDLTGIEDFTDLTELFCAYNDLTSLDVSNNTALTHLYCSSNQLTALNVSQNTALRRLRCDYNQLTSLDLSANPALTWLVCQYNNLTTLDIRNGNNISMDYTSFFCAQNPNLTCIDIDNAAWSTANWTVANGNIDPQHYFSNNCSGTTSIEENTKNKELFKVTDILGRETNGKKKQPLFYIFDDGTVEKRIIIE